MNSTYNLCASLLGTLFTHTHHHHYNQYSMHNSHVEFDGGREETRENQREQHIKQTQFTYGVRGARTSDPNLWNHIHW
jgi:hypothetical protein